MFRLFDWQCTKCNRIAERVEPAELKHLHADCPVCGTMTNHDRILSAPAPYLGEKPHNPEMMGGKFDTMGMRAPPCGPIMPDGLSYSGVKDYLNTREVKEARAERKKVIEENKMKRKRAQALRQGKNINMRVDRLPGDPKI